MLFNFAFQNLPQLSLAVINEDSNCTSAIPMGCDENQTDLSCHYLSILSDRRWHWDLVRFTCYFICKLSAGSFGPLFQYVRDSTGKVKGFLSRDFAETSTNDLQWLHPVRLRSGKLLARDYPEFYLSRQKSRDVRQCCLLCDPLGPGVSNML
jgi:hypothetical protein